MMSDDVRAFVQIVSGIVALAAGLVSVILIFGRLPVLGHLPGDFSIDAGTTVLEIPLGSSILIGAVVTAVAAVLSNLTRHK